MYRFSGKNVGFCISILILIVSYYDLLMLCYVVGVVTLDQPISQSK
jgi:hypothetical protein